MLDHHVLGFAANVFRDRALILWRSGVDDLDDTLVDGRVVPIGPHFHDLVVQIGADLTDAADDERLATESMMRCAVHNPAAADHLVARVRELFGDDIPVLWSLIPNFEA